MEGKKKNKIEINMDYLKLGSVDLYWLNGGQFSLDGGAMFGPVPKSLWSIKCSPDKDNNIQICSSPILIKKNKENILIDTGIGNRLNKKEVEIYRVKSNWNVINELESIGIKRKEILYVILTHCDFDHTGGVVMKNSSGSSVISFPRAKHIVQKHEWEDVLKTNLRTSRTYLKKNVDKLVDSNLLKTIDGNHVLSREIKLIKTGGHTRGHQIVEVCGKDNRAVHLGDLLPTHYHINPLWTMAYDNFPITVVRKKEELINKYIRKDYWFVFYHDPKCRAIRLDTSNNIIDKVPNTTMQ